MTKNITIAELVEPKDEGRKVHKKPRLVLGL